jgi:hypothetical protein
VHVLARTPCDAASAVIGFPVCAIQAMWAEVEVLGWLGVGAGVPRSTRSSTISAQSHSRPAATRSQLRRWRISTFLAAVLLARSPSQSNSLIVTRYNNRNSTARDHLMISSATETPGHPRVARFGTAQVFPFGLIRLPVTKRAVVSTSGAGAVHTDSWSKTSCPKCWHVVGSRG